MYIKTFTDDVEKFLINYHPEDEHMTSEREITLIAKVFNLETLTYDDFIKLRNDVVMFYSHLMDNEIVYGKNGEYSHRTDYYWQYSTAMMSVTAVIDYYNRGEC